MKLHKELNSERSTLLSVAIALIALTALTPASYAARPTEVELVKDVNPGPPDSRPYGMTKLDDETLLFYADDGTHGRELWKSSIDANGTEDATLVRDINPGPGESYFPCNNCKDDLLVEGDGIVFFLADDGVHGIELWKSDGTTAGTTLVKDIYQGSRPNGGQLAGLTYFKGALFFGANDGVSGHELWKSDGTAAGTTLVKDINPGPAWSGPTHFEKVDGTLFFTASDAGDFGASVPSADLPSRSRGQLWKTDGTAEGTMFVKDGLWPRNEMASFKGMLFFTAHTDGGGVLLWKSDGTAAGTSPVKDSSSGGGTPYSPFWLTELNGRLFFSGDDGVHGWELWRTDGTAEGTTLVKDITPGRVWGEEGVEQGPTFLTKVDNTLFFRADDGVHGAELWRSDGTAAGTTLVKDIHPGVGDHPEDGPGFLTDVNGTLFFFADDGTHGWELWSSDGTPEGTIMVEDINPGPVGSPGPAPLTNVDGTLYFRATDGIHGVELWKATPPIRTAPDRGGFKNASGFCKAEVEFLGRDAFREKYGTGKNGANAHGKCVKRNG